jgi:hypothetical protein
LPDYEAIARVQAKINETNVVRRSEYRSIQAHLARARLRPTLIDKDTALFGEKLESELTKTKARAAAILGTVKRARSLAKQTGFLKPEQINDDRAGTIEEGLRVILKAARESEE